MDERERFSQALLNVCVERGSAIVDLMKQPEERKAYSAPVLKAQGSLVALTLSGNGSGNDGGVDATMMKQM